MTAEDALKLARDPRYEGITNTRVWQSRAILTDRIYGEFYWRLDSDYPPCPLPTALKGNDWFAVTQDDRLSL